MNLSKLEMENHTTGELRYFWHSADKSIRDLWNNRDQAHWDGNDERAERCENLIAEYEQRMDDIDAELTQRGEELFPDDHGMNHPERYEVAENAYKTVFQNDWHPIVQTVVLRGLKMDNLHDESEFIQAVDAIDDAEWQELVELGVAAIFS